MLSNKINNVRYKFAIECAYDFLIENEISSLPFNPFKICEINGWKIEKASDVAKYLDCSVDNLLKKKLKTTDGIAIYCPTTDEYRIVYNDLLHNSGRIRWTLTHEIGHIVLRHLSSDVTSLSRGKLNDLEYVTYEREADCFAGIVLAPPIVLDRIGVKNSSAIQNICFISYLASQSRFNYIKNLYNFNDFEDYDSILEGAFFNFIYKKTCLKCGHGFISKKINNCPICGYKRMIRGDGDMLYNDGFQLDERNRAIECPICGNEQMARDGCYCRVCGIYLINKCTNDNGIWGYNEHEVEVMIKDPCGMVSEGNARYCELCGEQTTFFKQGLLKDWCEVKEEIKNKEIEITDFLGDETYLPVFNDDDPPF